MNLLEEASATLQAYAADYSEAGNKGTTKEAVAGAYKALLGHEDKLLSLAHRIEQEGFETTPEAVEALKTIGSMVAVIHKMDGNLFDAANAAIGNKEPSGGDDTEQSAEAILNRLLPAEWDYTKDIVSIAGTVKPSVFAALKDLGQVRVIALREPGAVYPDWVRVADSVAHAGGVISGFSTPAPEQIATLTAGNDPPNSQKGIERTEFHRLCHRAVQHNVSMLKTVEDLGVTWVTQGIQNLPKLAKHIPISTLLGAFENVPIVICGAGPSLTKQLPLLKELKGKAVLLAFSQSAKAMWAAGVIPDLVIAVDPSDLAYHFEGCDVSQAAGLVLGVTCHPSLYALPFKRHIYYAGNSQLEAWITSTFKESCDLPAAGTVAHSAYSLCGALHGNPLILVGMDLSFPQGKIYADNGADPNAHVVFEDGVARIKGHKWKWPDLGVFEVPGWHGGLVKTSALYHQFLGWFESQFLAAGQSVRILNCTEGGAYIPGAEHLRLADAMRLYRYPSVDVDAVLEAAAGKLDFPKRAGLVRDRLVAIQRGMAEAKRVASEIAATHDKYVKQPCSPTRKAFLKVEQELVDVMEPVGFLSLMHQAELRELEQEHAAATDRQNFLVKNGKKTALMVLEAINKIEGLLADAVEVAINNDASSFVSHMVSGLSGLRLDVGMR